MGSAEEVGGRRVKFGRIQMKEGRKDDLVGRKEDGTDTRRVNGEC